jgi:phosphoglycerol transferase MdoB-like AlkP superfamily enzyme
MGFDAFARMAGFDEYVGREQYNNDNDFDGHWGIWDEPFLQYTAQQLNKKNTPFVASIFTLNTHHPFQIPTKYANTFTLQGNAILRCVQYADMSLQRFFETIKKSNWFNNTLFIITADHVGPVIDNHLPLNAYRIPIIFYSPNKQLIEPKINHTIANQIDILPTILGITQYPDSVFCFGINLLQPNIHNTFIQYNAAIYQIVDSQFCYQFNGEKALTLYNHIQDTGFNTNLMHNRQQPHLDSTIKMQIQNFNFRLNNNKQTSLTLDNQ